MQKLKESYFTSLFCSYKNYNHLLIHVNEFLFKVALDVSP